MKEILKTASIFGLLLCALATLLMIFIGFLYVGIEMPVYFLGRNILSIGIGLLIDTFFLGVILYLLIKLVKFLLLESKEEIKPRAEYYPVEKGKNWPKKDIIEAILIE